MDKPQAPSNVVHPNAGRRFAFPAYATERSEAQYATHQELVNVGLRKPSPTQVLCFNQSVQQPFRFNKAIEMEKFSKEELYWLRKVLNDELGDEDIPDDIADSLATRELIAWSHASATYIRGIRASSLMLPDE
ncbi:MAG: hypothetical protein P4L87_01865 [Formivibrio sp.]|nr:hypothetical protein [Formivibrio sp.]